MKGWICACALWGVVAGGGPLYAQCPSRLDGNLIAKLHDHDVRKEALAFTPEAAIAASGSVTGAIMALRTRLAADREALRAASTLATTDPGRRTLLEDRVRLGEGALRLLECRQEEASPRSTGNDGSGGAPAPRATSPFLGIDPGADAAAAALEAGMAQTRGEAEAEDVAARLAMAQRAVRDWRPPRQLARRASPPPVLADPFAVAAPAARDAVTALTAEHLRDTGLELDEARGLAVVATTRPPGCLDRLQPGDYPLLDDGGPLDTGQRVQVFLAQCLDRARPLRVLRGAGDLVVIP